MAMDLETEYSVTWMHGGDWSPRISFSHNIDQVSRSSSGRQSCGGGGHDSEFEFFGNSMDADLPSGRSMLSADELFCDGKLRPLEDRQQHRNSDAEAAQSSNDDDDDDDIAVAVVVNVNDVGKNFNDDTDVDVNGRLGQQNSVVASTSMRCIDFYPEIDDELPIFCPKALDSDDDNDGGEFYELDQKMKWSSVSASSVSSCKCKCRCKTDLTSAKQGVSEAEAKTSTLQKKQLSHGHSHSHGQSVARSSAMAKQGMQPKCETRSSSSQKHSNGHPLAGQRAPTCETRSASKQGNALSHHHHQQHHVARSGKRSNSSYSYEASKSGKKHQDSDTQERKATSGSTSQRGANHHSLNQTNGQNQSDLGQARATNQSNLEQVRASNQNGQNQSNLGQARVLNQMQINGQKQSNLGQARVSNPNCHNQSNLTQATPSKQDQLNAQTRASSQSQSRVHHLDHNSLTSKDLLLLASAKRAADLNRNPVEPPPQPPAAAAPSKEHNIDDDDENEAQFLKKFSKNPRSASVDGGPFRRNCISLNNSRCPSPVRSFSLPSTTPASPTGNSRSASPFVRTAASSTKYSHRIKGLLKKLYHKEKAAVPQQGSSTKSSFWPFSKGKENTISSSKSSNSVSSKPSECNEAKEGSACDNGSNNGAMPNKDVVYIARKDLPPLSVSLKPNIKPANYSGCPSPTTRYAYSASSSPRRKTSDLVASKSNPRYSLQNGKAYGEDKSAMLVVDDRLMWGSNRAANYAGSPGKQGLMQNVETVVMVNGSRVVDHHNHYHHNHHRPLPPRPIAAYTSSVRVTPVLNVPSCMTPSLRKTTCASNKSPKPKPFSFGSLFAKREKLETTIPS